MRPLRFLLLGSLVLPFAAPSARADQTPVALHLARTLFDARPTPDSARIGATLTQADEALAAGRMSAARKLYRAVIQEQRDARQYAGDAMWRLAITHVYEGDSAGGAAMLDELAAEASRYGDPTVELRATFEAAALWQKVKRHDLARRNLERVQCLLQSPAIAEVEKARVQRRIVA